MALGAADSDAERRRLAADLLELALGRRSGSMWALSEPLLGALAGDRARDRADAALLELGRHWQSLDARVREAILEFGPDRLRKAVRRLIDEDREPACLSAIHIARACARPETAASITPLLASQSREVAHLAERCLVEIAHLIGDGGVPTSGAAGEDQASLESSLALAARETPRHRRRGAVEAAIALVRPALLAARPGRGGASPIARWLDGTDHPSHMIARAALRTGEFPWGRQRALVLLTHEAMRASALERLARAHNPDDHEAVLGSFHLLAHPVRRRRLKQVRVRRSKRATAGGGGSNRTDLAPGGSIPDASQRRDLSETARAALPRWICCLDLTDPERSRELARLLDDPSGLVRAALVRHADARLLRDLCLDADAGVARSAMLRRSPVGCGIWPRGRAALNQRSREGVEAAWLGRLARSPHRGVRRLAREEIQRLGAGGGESPLPRLAARRALLKDPERFIDHLRASLREGRSGHRITAIRLASALGIEAALELDLLLLVGASHAKRTGDPRRIREDDRVAASAVLALGRLDSASTLATLRASLGHPDQRVRANAVEGLARRARRRGAPADQILLELKADRHHRVRANSIKAIADLPDPRRDRRSGDGGEGGGGGGADQACDQAASMLGDDRPMHRIAGLWLTRRLLSELEPRPTRSSMHDLVTRVGEMVRADAEPQVRARAAACSVQLVSRVRHAWRQAVAADESAGD